MFKHIDGFDHYMAVGAAASSMANYLNQAGYTTANLTTTNFALIAGTDNVGAAIRLTLQSAASNPPVISRPVQSTQNLIVFGFNFRGSGARQRIARLNNLVDLDWDITTGKMRIGGVQGANVIILNAWWYIELVIDKASEELRIYANDALQMTVPLASELMAATTFTLTWGMTTAPEATGTVEYDDLYVLDSDPTDATNITRRGPMVVTTRRPTADVEAGWTVVNSQSQNHAEIAAQLDPGRVGAPYLQANIDGRTDKYLSNTVLPNNNEIFAVALVSYARKGDLDEREIGMLVETDGGSLEKRRPLTEAFRFHQVVFEQAPGGVAWNQNRVESSEFGPVAR